MSSDLIAIVVAGGRARGAWSRWGALSLARDLLQGEAAFVAYLGTLQPIDPIELVRWMCGLVVVDHDARTLGLWREARGLWRSALRALIELRWPGWRVVPLDDLRALPGAAPRPVEPARVEDVIAAQARAWAEVCADRSYDAWIAEAGEASVREAMEATTHALWVAVRAGDAIRHDLWCDDGEVAGAALTIGRAGIDAVLATRPAGTLPLAWDGLLRAAAVIDVAARVLTLWQDDPPYADLIGALERAWPGWRIERSLDLPAHLAALGLDPTRSWGPDTQRDLDAAFARTLGERETGAALLARVIPAITRPGERVTITDPGSSLGPAEQPADALAVAFARWCAARTPSEAQRIEWPPPRVP
ncbi:MAG: hypothetical protein JNK64_39445 [Myxococcales bacterium]|nr:hypothetical protein [Myxococcales bacterium]